MLMHEKIVDAVKKTTDVIHAPLPQGAIIEIGKTVSVL